MKVFVTGSTGFIGRHFLEELIKSNLSPLDISLLQRSGNQAESPYKILRSDLENLNSYKNELLHCDYVYHIAASADVTSSKESVWKDYQSLERIIETLKRNKGLKRLIFISTIGAFDRSSSPSLKNAISNNCAPNPRSDYGKVKLESEKLIKDSGVPFTIIRPSWVWGKGMRTSSHISFFNKLIEKNSVIARFGFPGNASFIHVEDLAKSMVKIINDNDFYLNKSYFAATEKKKVSKVISDLWKLNNKSSWMINLSIFRIFSSLHNYLPLPLDFLFFDYLVCDGSDFCKDFKLSTPKKLSSDLSTVLHRDQYAIITGANGGIGLELAKKLQSRYQLLLIDKNIDKLSNTFSSDQILQIDLSVSQNLNKLNELKLKRKVGLLINNAGVGFKSDFMETSIDKELLTVNVNMAAPLILTHKYKEHLEASRGTLVNIASSVASFPLPYMSTYAASKSFMLSWSQAIEEELRGKIKVITFSPSGTRTNFQQQAGVKDSKDLMSPSLVAEEILRLILKDKSDAKLIGLKSKVLKLILKIAPRQKGLKLVAKLFQGNR